MASYVERMQGCHQTVFPSRKLLFRHLQPKLKNKEEIGSFSVSIQLDFSASNFHPASLFGRSKMGSPARQFGASTAGAQTSAVPGLGPGDLCIQPDRDF